MRKMNKHYREKTKERVNRTKNSIENFFEDTSWTEELSTERTNIFKEFFLKSNDLKTNLSFFSFQM